MYRLITILLAVCFLPLKAQEPGDDVFATDQILKVELSFSQSGFWDSLVNNYSSETYMKADVTITDLTGVQVLEDIGIRLKGNSSYGHPGDKKSFKIDFNRYVDSLDYDKLEKLNFNNCFKDPTFMREKIMYDLSHDAAVPAPRCIFANVYMNGTYWGFYDVVEQIDDDFLNTHFDNSSENYNTIKKISSSQLLSSSLNGVNNDGSSLTLGTGIESKLKIDSLGSEWTNDTWYSHSINKSDQFFFTSYTTPFLILSGGDGKADNIRDYFNAKSDLKLKLKKKFTLESGLQVSINNYRNETNYFRESNGIRKADSSRTNTFRYHENINALYLQGSKTIGKNFVAKFGTRVENTNMKGRQFVPGDTSFSIHRTDLFPYIYLSKPVMKIAGYELRAYLVYRRTIRRPYYDQLNPFSRYIDEYLSETGNPSLQPQFTQNFEANISVDERPILAIGINDTKDIFTNVIYQSDTSQSQAYRTYDNLGKNKEWYFRGLGALPPGGRYFFVLGAQYNHNYYNGLYENKPLSFKRGSWTFFTYQTFRIDKRSVITLNGFMRLKGQQQFYELTTFGALNTSVNRKFFKDKLIVTVSMNDLFLSNKNNFSIKQGSVNATGFRQSDTRRAGINLRYNFGIRKKEENNNMFNIESPEKPN